MSARGVCSFLSDFIYRQVGGQDCKNTAKIIFQESKLGMHATLEMISEALANPNRESENLRQDEGISYHSSITKST